MEANETVEPISQGPNFLDEDMGSVDTSMPVIKGPLTTELEIVSVDQADSADKTGQNLVIKMKTVGEHKGTKGEPISAGFPLTKWIGLTPMVGRPGKKDYSPDDIRRSLAQFLEAVEGKKGSINPRERFTGMRVIVKIGVQPGNEKYPNESNSVTWVKKG